MSMEYIRRAYGVPAKRGARVNYTGGGFDDFGTIVSAKGGRLRVRMDKPSMGGKTLTFKLHPTWRVEYLKTPNAKFTGPRVGHRSSDEHE